VRVLISGGSGFVGLAIANAVAASGGTPIIFADRAPPARFLAAAASDGAPVTVHIGDIRSAEDVTAAVQATSPTHVVHAAALTPAPRTEGAIAARVLDVNVTGTAVLMNTVAGRVQSVVSLSSIAVYGDTLPADSPLAESHAPMPAGIYGISKLSGELVARHIADRSGTKLSVVRVGPVFGPFEYETGVRDLMSPHLQMLRLARKGQAAVLPWRLAADWIYSADVGAGVLAMLNREGRGFEVFNLSGTATDLRQWGDLLGKHVAGASWRLAGVGEEANVAYGIGEERALLDNRKIASAGFQPAFSIDEAANHFLGWMERHTLDVSPASDV
jgi:nucleoside-diphosphate-sugar epimerase